MRTRHFDGRAVSQGHLPAHSRPAVPTRAHQHDDNCPAHGSLHTARPPPHAPTDPPAKPNPPTHTNALSPRAPKPTHRTLATPLHTTRESPRRPAPPRPPRRRRRLRRSTA